MAELFLLIYSHQVEGQEKGRREREREGESGMQKQRDDGDLWQLLLQRSPGSLLIRCRHLDVPLLLPTLRLELSSQPSIGRSASTASGGDGYWPRRPLSLGVRFARPFQYVLYVDTAVDTGLSTVCLHLRV